MQPVTTQPARSPGLSSADATVDVADEPREGQTRAGHAIDILLVMAAFTGAYALESWAAASGLVNVGETAQGAFTVVVGALTTLLIVHLRGGSWIDLGFKRPARWSTVPLWVIGILVAFVAGQALVPRLLSIFIELPAPDFSRYNSIVGNLPAALALAVVLPLAAAVPEEIVYRGFLIGRLEAIFGDISAAPVLAVAIQSVIFGLVHVSWGIGGILLAGIMGAIWGTAYLLCGRNLWIVIMAHAGGHIMLVVGLYLS